LKSFSDTGRVGIIGLSTVVSTVSSTVRGAKNKSKVVPTAKTKVNRKSTLIVRIFENIQFFGVTGQVTSIQSRFFLLFICYSVLLFFLGCWFGQIGILL
jgi:hypothetical protein